MYFILGRIRRDEYVITDVEMQGDILEREQTHWENLHTTWTLFCDILYPGDFHDNPIR